MWKRLTPMQGLGKSYRGLLFERGSVNDDRPGVFILFTYTKNEDPNPADYHRERMDVTLNLCKDVPTPAVGEWTHCWFHHEEEKEYRSEALTSLSDSRDVFAFFRSRPWEYT